MAALVANRLTPQDFGDCWYPIPRARNGGAAGGLGRGYPAGGTTAQYKRLHRIAIAENNLMKCRDFLNFYCEMELERLGVTKNTQPWISMYAALHLDCLRALQTAWNSCQHMRPTGGRFFNWGHERTLEDLLTRSRWITDRNNVITQIRQAVSTNPQLAVQNPAPAPLYSIPQWYTDEVAAENTRLAAIAAAAPAPVTAPPSAAPGSTLGFLGQYAVTVPPAAPPVAALSASTTAPVTAPLATAPPAPGAPNHGLQWANETLASLAPRFGGTVWEYTASDEEVWNLLG